MCSVLVDLSSSSFMYWIGLFLNSLGIPAVVHFATRMRILSIPVYSLRTVHMYSLNVSYPPLIIFNVYIYYLPDVHEPRATNELHVTQTGLDLNHEVLVTFEMHQSLFTLNLIKSLLTLNLF
jgi:hypothetical protein